MTKLSVSSNSVSRYHRIAEIGGGMGSTCL